MLSLNIAIIALSYSIRFIDTKFLFVASLFRHGDRLSYINFSENKRNANTLTEQGQKSAYIAGKELIDLFQLKHIDNKPLAKENIMCYEGERPRTIQTLSFRLGGMFDLPLNLLLNKTQTGYHDFNSYYCNIDSETAYLFPKKRCKRLMVSQLYSHKQFNDYINNVLKSINHIDLLTTYLSSDLYYKNNTKENIYEKLNIINDYLILASQNYNSSIKEEENEMGKALNSFQYNYFEALLQNANVIRVMVAKYYQLILMAMEKIINKTTNSLIKYMLFSNHELTIASIIRSLNIIKDDLPLSISFNDALNIVLIEENNKLFIAIYYNKKQIKMSHCNLYCPYEYFTNVIIKQYTSINDDEIESLCKETTHPIDEL